MILFVALSCLLLTGCDRVTRENYAKIQNGMTMDEVVAILGEPIETASVGIGPLEATTAQWKGKKGMVSIQFVDQKVRIKRFLADAAAEADRHR
jgi:hypothetical protein